MTPHELEAREADLHRREMELAARSAQNQLADRQARLETLFEAVPDAVVAVDAECRIESASSAAERLFACSSEALRGKDLRVFLPAFSLEPQGSPGLRELIAIRRDGTTIPVEVARGKLPSGDGHARVVFVRDITERKRHEEELHESLARFRQIADRIEDAVYVAEASTGRLLYVSPAFARIFGRTPEIGEGVPWLAWVHERDREAALEAWAGALRGTGFDEERRVVRPDGSVRLVRHRCFPILVQDRVTGVLEDVTEERRRTEQMRQLERLEALGTVAGGVAHDFNNLLMGLAGCTTLALTKLEPKHPAHRHVQKAKDVVAKGASITGRLLRFVGSHDTAEEPLALDAEVHESQEFIQRLVGEHIRVSVATSAPAVRVLGERGEIEQILVNLATNARDAMPSGGQLRIETRADGKERVVLSARDTGVGIDPAVKARVFEPFFTTKEVGKGTGLGLPIVLGIAQRLRGAVEIESEPGKGTEVLVRLPVHSVVPPPPRQNTPARVDGGTVLVVEDEALVATAVQTHLESLGYEVVSAASPCEALRLFQENAGRIDLVLTDVVMPGLLGGDLAREFRTIEPGIPVVYMSAHPRGELLRLGRIDGKSPFLQKPFDKRTLGAALSRAVAENERAPRMG
jgi:PAS domain S-box-containing protein